MDLDDCICGVYEIVICDVGMCYCYNDGDIGNYNLLYYLYV